MTNYIMKIFEVPTLLNFRLKTRHLTHKSEIQEEHEIFHAAQKHSEMYEL